MKILPNIPNPDVIADSVASGVKAVFDGVLGAAKSLGVGVKDICSYTVDGFGNVAKGDANLAAQALDNAASSLRNAAEGIRSQVDRGIGKEVVQKVKREIEH